MKFASIPAHKKISRTRTRAAHPFHIWRTRMKLPILATAILLSTTVANSQTVGFVGSYGDASLYIAAVNISDNKQNTYVP